MTWFRDARFGRKGRTISRDLITGLVLVMTASLIFTGAVYFYFAAARSNADFEKKADEYARHLRESLEAPIWTFDDVTVERICEAFIKNDIAAWIRVTNYLGDELFRRQARDASHRFQRTERITHDGRVIGTVDISLTREAHRKNLTRMLLSNLMLLLATVVVIITATRALLATFLNRPLAYLLNRIRAITRGDFGAPVHEYPQAEIQAVIHEFNRMTEEIARREKALNDLNMQLRSEIEERRQAEERLRDSERRTAQIINFLPDPTFVIDAGSRVIAWNHAVEKLSGAPAAEMIGKGDYAYAIPFYGERRPVLIDLVMRWDGETAKKYNYVRRKGDTLISETRNPPFKQGESWFWNAACPLYDEEQRIIGAIETIRDITEIKQAEAALRQSEMRFRSLFNSSPDGVLMADFKGVILDVNKSLMRMTGRPREYFTNRRFKDLIPAPHHEAVSKAVRSLEIGVAEEPPLEIEYEKADGSTAPAAVRAWVVTDEKSAPIALGAFVKDIAREKAMAAEKEQLEKQLRRQQKMEAIGVLAGGVAHDFNNILGGIIGYAEILALKLSMTDDQLVKYVTRILEAGNRARDLVHQILQFSRQDDAAMGPVRVASVLKEAMKLLRAALPRTIEMRRRIGPGDAAVMGDATQIHQVIMNLCTNAFHAMRETGGVLTVGLDCVALTAPRRAHGCEIPPGDYLRLSVTDTGPGIPRGIQERIFEPYFTTKQVNEGAGLGLSVVLGVVKKHGGLIEAEAAPEKGAAFTVFLPALGEGDGVAASPEAPAPPGNKERILLVDDEPFFLDAVLENIRSLGYEGAAFQKSRDALAAFASDPDAFDLVITDQTMPEMTGVELIARIRGLNDAVPIILCTGFSETVTEETAVRHGVSKFLLKPVTRKALADAIAKLIRRSGASGADPE